jgi:monofunctional glycosyltransferase
MINRSIFSHQKNRKLIFIPFKNISRNVKKIIIIAEDKNFYKHSGIDLEAIQYSYELNRKFGFFYSGASTITQQLVRTLFLVPNKNYLRKIIEIQTALIVDWIMKKDRILELYLNYIEFGKGVYGIGAASWYHYGKSYYSLSEDEIIKLFTIMPSPLRYNTKNFYKNPNLLSRYIFLNSNI